MIRYLKIMSMLVILSFSLINIANGQDPTKMYDETVKSCGIVTDKQETGIASGFFISFNIFITNRHVTKALNRNSIIIRNKNGEEFLVKRVIKEYSKSDIAILETETNSSSYLLLSNPDDIKTGEKVYAIGNPSSSDAKVYDFSFSEGIVNNITFEEINSPHFNISAKVIIHSATLNPGNSGGPLVNSKGEVIGVNAFAKGGMINNIFFAIHLSELVTALNENNIKFSTINNKFNSNNIDSNTAQVKKDSGIIRKDSINASKESLQKTGDTVLLKPNQNVDNDSNYLLIIIIIAIGLPAIIIPVLAMKRKDVPAKQIDQYQSNAVNNTEQNAVPEKAVSELKAQILYNGGKYSILKTGMVIGREADCNICILDKDVSRKHIQIIYDGYNFIAIDLDSKNGTYINNKAIKREVLRDGDIITFGSEKMIFIKV